MDNVSTGHTMAPATQPHSIVDGKSNNTPHPKTMGPNITRLHRFPKTDKMEALPTDKRNASVGNFLTTLDTTST